MGRCRCNSAYDLSPLTLAELSAGKGVQLFALRKTWAFARAVSPFYRDLLPDPGERPVDMDALWALPILTKDILAENYVSIYGTRPLPAGMLFTGGSTSRPQIVFVSDEEIKLRAGLAAIDKEDDAAERRLTLVTSGGSQGSLPVSFDKSGAICVPLRSRSGYEWV